MRAGFSRSSYSFVVFAHGMVIEQLLEVVVAVCVRIGASGVVGIVTT